MVWRRASWCGTLLLLAGCSGPIGLYHDVEGGAIAQKRQAPPGADLPYPNLASVPPAPAGLSASSQAAVTSRVSGTAPAGVSPAAPGALAGLALPSGPPPAPVVPGFSESTGSSAASIPAAPAAAAPMVAPPGAPVSMAFQPGSALLDHDTAVALSGLVSGVGTADVLVGGFGEAASQGDDKALALALARARRLADALTADGVAGTKIRLVAAAAGSGGFVQLVY